MKIRIGDLVEYNDDGYVRKGLVSETKSRFLTPDGLEVIERRGELRLDIRFVIDRENVTKITPREEVKEYWRYL